MLILQQLPYYIQEISRAIDDEDVLALHLLPVLPGHRLSVLMIDPSALKQSDACVIGSGIDSASVAVEEDAMTDPNRSDAIDPTDTSDDTARDPDRHSTWNTIEGTVNVDEVLDEDDLENFFVEPIPESAQSRRDLGCH